MEQAIKPDNTKIYQLIKECSMHFKHSDFSFSQCFFSYMKRRGFVKNGKVDLGQPIIKAFLLEVKDSGELPPDFIKEPPKKKKSSK